MTLNTTPNTTHTQQQMVLFSLIITLLTGIYLKLKLYGRLHSTLAKFQQVTSHYTVYRMVEMTISRNGFITVYLLRLNRKVVGSL